MNIDEELVIIRFYDGITMDDYNLIKKFIKDNFSYKYEDISFVEWKEKQISMSSMAEMEEFEKQKCKKK